MDEDRRGRLPGSAIAIGGIMVGHEVGAKVGAGVGVAGKTTAAAGLIITNSCPTRKIELLLNPLS